MERWLHQHIFKVGWLITRSFETTTVLYYTFFLPGIILHQFVIWLAAGVLDVRAERAIKLPAKQEIGQLRLNFVQLSRRASSFKVNLISLTPLPVALAVIWLVANNVIDIQTSFAIMRSGQLSDVAEGIRHLTATPDFWLWAYVLFSISNTMMPHFRLPSGWLQRLALILVIALLPLFIIGIGDEIMQMAVQGPLAVMLNTLSGVLLVVIFFDFLGVLILGTIEAVLERITGASATFSKGKMTVMTREEAVAYRRARRERDRQQQKRRKAARTAAKAGPPTVYRLTFPIPGPPGSEPVTHHAASIIEPEQTTSVFQPAPRPARIEPSVVPGIVSRKPIDETVTEDIQSSTTPDASPTVADSSLETSKTHNEDHSQSNKADSDNKPAVTSPRPTPTPAVGRLQPSDQAKNTDIADRLAAFRARKQGPTETQSVSDEADDDDVLDELRYEDSDDSP